MSMDYKDKKEDIIEELKGLDSQYLSNWKDRQKSKRLDDQYISSVYDKVIQGQEATVITLIKKPKVWAIAASLFIALSAFYVLQSSHSNELEELDDEHILVYLMESDLTTEDLTDIADVKEQLAYDIDVNEGAILDFLGMDIEELDLNELNTY